MVSVWSAQDALVVWWEDDSDLFQAAAIARMSADFEGMLRGIVADSDGRLDDLDILSPRERAALTADVREPDLERDFAFGAER